MGRIFLKNWIELCCSCGFKRLLWDLFLSRCRILETTPITFLEAQYSVLPNIVREFSGFCDGEKKTHTHRKSEYDCIHISKYIPIKHKAADQASPDGFSQ